MLAKKVSLVEVACEFRIVLMNLNLRQPQGGKRVTYQNVQKCTTLLIFFSWIQSATSPVKVGCFSAVTTTSSKAKSCGWTEYKESSAPKVTCTKSQCSLVKRQE